MCSITVRRDVRCKRKKKLFLTAIKSTTPFHYLIYHTWKSWLTYWISVQLFLTTNGNHMKTRAFWLSPFLLTTFKKNVFTSLSSTKKSFQYGSALCTIRRCALWLFPFQSYYCLTRQLFWWHPYMRILYFKWNQNEKTSGGKGSGVHYVNSKNCTYLTTTTHGQKPEFEKNVIIKVI